MATKKVANAFTTYQAQANREDLSSSIYNIDPFDTPVVSMAARRTVKNRQFDWQTDNLPVVDIDNAREEGFELQRRQVKPTVRRSNVTQISSRDATVSGTQEASDAAGKSSGEMAYQMASQSKVLKSDIELIACSRQARADGDDAATPVPRRTESIPHQIARALDRNDVQGAAVAGVPAAVTTATTAWAAVAGASQVAMTETIIGDAMEKAYSNGAEPTKLIVPPGVKRTISTFKGRESSQITVGKTEVVATVDIIATDFGRITALPSRWLPSDLGLQLDPEYVAMAFFRTFRQYPIAKIGDAETRMILAEWGTEVRQGMAHIVYNGIKKGAVIGAP